MGKDWHFLKCAISGKTLLDSPGHTATDIELRERKGEDEDLNTGPICSNISKSCKKVGIPSTAVLVKAMRKIGKGKMLYRYKLTDAAVRVLKALPDITKGEPIFD